MISRGRIEFLDLKYPDVAGRLRHVTLPIERLESAVRDGVGFDSSSVAGYRSVEEGDMVLKPDLDSTFVDPFAERPTLSCFARVCDPVSHEVYERDPRGILDRAVLALTRLTRADAVMVRPEFEFYLFNRAEFHTQDDSAEYRIETDELKHDDQTGLTLFKGSAYHVAPPFDRSSDFRSELASLMAGCGVPVKYHHHEGGRHSQVEVEPSFLPALKAADGVTLAKYLVRNLAFRSGKTATFMPKPIYGEPGSGMHFHQYVAKDGTSLFGDRKSPGLLSRLGSQYVAGILGHVASLCAFTNPSTNSYRRLVPGYEAPTLGFHAIGNRNAAVRIPAYLRNPLELSIEYRIPDGTCNPYLALAATVLAGLDGIIRELEPVESTLTGSRDPIRGAPYRAETRDARARPGGSALPRSLPEALAALNADNDYLRRDGVFPAGLIDFWHGYKRAEAESVALRPHPWEYSLYYGC